MNLTQALFKLLFLHCDSKHVRYCVPCLRAESLFLTVFQPSCTQVLLAFKAKFLGNPIPSAGSLSLGALCTDPWILGEYLCNYGYSLLCGLPTWGSEFFLFVCFVLFFCFFKIFIYLFIYGCVGSSFPCEGFLQLRQAGATLHRGARASHYRGLSCCGSQAPDAQAQ